VTKIQWRYASSVEKCWLYATVQCESTPPPEIFWHFFPNGWEYLTQILHAYYQFLSTLDYKFWLNDLQPWRSYAILLSATTIMCSNCQPSTETHLWYPIGDNWIKICVLTCMWTFSRRVKFGLKIHNCLVKMSENATVCFGRWWTFCAHDVNWVVTLNMA